MDPEAAQDDADPELVPLTVGLGYIPSVQFAQFYLADEAGYYDEAGLDVTIEQGKGSTAAVQRTGVGQTQIGLADRMLRGARLALAWYGLYYGAFPYPQLTVVSPPRGAEEAGGMEYPTLFTAGTGLFTTPDMYRPESVTVHEAGHQFWYGIVGSNEFEHAWLDEGLDTFSTYRTFHEAYGERVARELDMARETQTVLLPDRQTVQEIYELHGLHVD